MRLLESKGARRRVILFAAVLMPGLIALTPATASVDQVPFTARLAGSAAFSSPTTVEFHGAGEAIQLGRFGSSGLAVLEPPTGSCPDGAPGIPNVHTETLAAANGDELVVRMVNVGCPTGPFTFHGTGHWTVVGGTGRFRDVTGEGTDEGFADFATSTFRLTLTGTLSRL